MYFETRTGALQSACRHLGIDVDPEVLDKKARELGVALPIESGFVSAPSLGGTKFAHRVPIERITEMRDAVRQILGSST